jgi:serine protease
VKHIDAALHRLRQRSDVEYAVPDVRAHIADFVPDDPGRGTTPGGWAKVQWNFAGPFGVNAPAAWANAIAAGRPGGRGVVIAVLDTGAAYSHRASGRYSPDLHNTRFVAGWDFVHNDPYAQDVNGHGTHVTSTIAESTNNGIALTGLAYRAALMPVRVLDRYGSGQAADIARGIRYAVDHGANVINMSFNFGCHKKVPVINEELRRANKKGVVTVASIGNLGAESCVAPPATGPGVIGVGGTTQGGCLGAYSLIGKGVDVVAPGGGTPIAGCPSVLTGPIYQVTLKGGKPGIFAEPGDYVGTSMAAAHVSGVTAMILASGVLPPKLKGAKLAAAVQARLEGTARSIGLPRTEQGAGLIDAGRATDPSD